MNAKDKEKFINKYNLKIPQIIQKELIADIETPISTLIKISQDEKFSFLLESVEGGDQRGRFSILGCDPDIIWEIKNNKVEIKDIDNKLDLSNISKDPIKSLKELVNFSAIERDVDAPPFPILVGYLGYPMIQFMENIKLKNPDEINIPDALMIRPKLVAVFDNIKNTINLMTSIYPNDLLDAERAFNFANIYINNFLNKLKKDISIESSNSNQVIKNINFKSNYTKKEYFKIIDKAKTYIKNGDVFQVVPSQRFTSNYNLTALSLYRSLRRLNPSPFLVNLNFNNIGLVASSPEILVTIKK